MFPKKYGVFRDYKRNIFLFKSNATDEQIMNAAKISCADEFI